MDDGESMATDPALELYKLEYERCTIRYEEIYKALWTNFSYLAVVAGAILTFGGDRFPIELSVLLACTPLIFWFWSNFVPLNEYGDKVEERLSWIEQIVNDRYNLLAAATEQHSELDLHKGLRHYSEFKARKEPRRKVGVRHVVYGLSTLLHIVAVVFFIAFVFGKVLVRPKPKETQTMTIDLKDKPLEIKLTGIDLNELKRFLDPQEVKVIVIDSKEGGREAKMTSVSSEELKKLLEKTENKEETGKSARKKEHRRSHR